MIKLKLFIFAVIYLTIITIMKKKIGIKMMVTAMLSVVLLFTVSCKKKEVPSAPKGIKAEVFEDHIRLSWNRVFNADYYSISVDFYGRDSNNCISDETYSVFLDETSNTYYKDIYPFDGMNHYKVKAVNEYGSSSYSEVSCSYSTNGHVGLYPNPSIGRLTIEASSMSYITVISMSGQVMFNYDVSSGSAHFEFSQFPAGIYFAHIIIEDDGEIEGRETVKRFVIAHD